MWEKVLRRWYTVSICPSVIAPYHWPACVKLLVSFLAQQSREATDAVLITVVIIIIITEESPGPRGRCTQVQILSPLLYGCVTLSKLLKLSDPVSSSVKRGRG